ncbi:uncharacterized protein LOC129906071 [Episyrphus balteatus]|uniref:uncharacterized protein LOC129906071 n=1 Tax=Episyrphus balteatus TaxID=286459 RepID=UPI0024867794|nr:uncharacterized protein LOC129906071 [Episyrphus balteatus]
MNLKYHFLVIIAMLNNFCCASEFNLETCTVHHLHDREYGYKDFFEVSSLKKNWLKANERLHLQFYVMTTMEAHILLSEDKNPKWENGSSARGYEIVLGGIRNSLSWINVGNSTIRVPVKVNSPKILSAFEPIPVEIIQTNDGEIIVNIIGYAEPLLKYWDVTSTPVNIKFFSFGTYKKESAKWFYNCLSDGHSNIESQTKLIGERNQEDYANRQTNLSGTGPTNRHVSFFLGLVPTLDNFKDDQVIDFQSEVIELVKKIKNPARTKTTTTTTTTEKPRYKIDVRMGYTEKKGSP